MRSEMPVCSESAKNKHQENICVNMEPQESGFVSMILTAMNGNPAGTASPPIGASSISPWAGHTVPP